MRRILLLVGCSLPLAVVPVLAQQAPAYAPPPRPVLPNAAPDPRSQFQQQLVKLMASPGEPAKPLQRFNIDFPGGSPRELVAYIETELHHPLNVIVNDQDDDVQIPPLKMNGVTVPQLFQALEAASRRQESWGYGGGTMTTEYGFQTSGEPTDNSIWFFHDDRPGHSVASPPKTCRFFSLAKYLEHGFTVDDITTAIQSGWKMTGASPTPELRYHKETKLLIACGDPAEINTIDSVLQALPSSNVTKTELQSMQEDIQQLKTQVDKLSQRTGKDLEPMPDHPASQNSGK